MNVLALHTSTHTPDKATSGAMVQAVLSRIVAVEPTARVKWINAAELHIVENQSCYAEGERNCGNPKAGPYRCWAHYNSVKEPHKYGGVDQMPVIYDALDWADVVIFSSSARWASHTAIMQRVIERMNTLDGREPTWGEPSPMRGKRLGVVFGGFHWQVLPAARRLAMVMRDWDFDIATGDNAILYWQRTDDPSIEQPDSNLPYVEDWLDSRDGQRQVDRFVRSLIG